MKPEESQPGATPPGGSPPRKKKKRHLKWHIDFAHPEPPIKEEPHSEDSSFAKTLKMLNNDQLYYGQEVGPALAARLKHHEQSDKTYVIPKTLEEVFGAEKRPEEYQQKRKNERIMSDRRYGRFLQQ